MDILNQQHAEGVKDCVAIATTQTQFPIKVNGEEFTVDFAKMHPTWVAHYLTKGAQRRLNDDMSGESPQDKQALTRKMLAEIHAGKPYEAPARASRMPKDPVLDLARKTAKQILVAAFRKATGKVKLQDMYDHEAVKPFFRETESTIAWDDAKVDDWMKRMRDAGKRDFMAEAKEALTLDDGDDLLRS